MTKKDKIVPKMSVVKLTPGKIATAKGVSEHTVVETLKGRRKNPKVIAMVNEWNEHAQKFIG
jgi:hypothetical protein